MALSNEQYDAIEREYDRRRARNAAEFEERRQRLFDRLPELAPLEEEMTDLAFQGAVAAAGGNRGRMEECAAKRVFLAERKKQLLAEAGIPPAELEMKYDCPLCRDTGFVDNRPCECRRQAVVDLLYDQSGLKEILKRENFGTFRADVFSDEKDGTGKSVREVMLENKRILREYVRDFGKKRGNILLRGNTGTGKTFMTHCIAKALLDDGFSVIYLTAGQLFDIMAEETFSQEDRDGERTGNLKTCDLLIIDDLGTELTNRFTVTGLFNCLNDRMNEGRSMVISTNLSLEEMRELYTERVTSRIMGNFRIRTFPGADIRLTAGIRAGRKNQ